MSKRIAEFGPLGLKSGHLVGAGNPQFGPMPELAPAL